MSLALKGGNGETPVVFGGAALVEGASFALAHCPQKYGLENMPVAPLWLGACRKSDPCSIGDDLGTHSHFLRRSVGSLAWSGRPRDQDPLDNSPHSGRGVAWPLRVATTNAEMTLFDLSVISLS